MNRLYVCLLQRKKKIHFKVILSVTKKFNILSYTRVVCYATSRVKSKMSGMVHNQAKTLYVLKFVLNTLVSVPQEWTTQVKLFN